MELTAPVDDSDHTLLLPHEEKPVRVQRAGARAACVLICDHAGRRVPERLGDLGVAAPDWDRHIAWDIGAAALTERLGEALEACTVMQAYSRLVIDCNRDPGRADCTPVMSDGTPVPGNMGLTPGRAAARVAQIHAPYHAAIAAELDARAASGRPALPVFVHSFTPRMNGLDRPWSFGVLHEGGSRLSLAMLAALREEAGHLTGDNEPYAMNDQDHSAPRHALARGLDYLELEVRQDLIADAAGVERVADILLRRLAEARAATGGAAA